MIETTLTTLTTLYMFNLSDHSASTTQDSHRTSRTISYIVARSFYLACPIISHTFLPRIG